MIYTRLLPAPDKKYAPEPCPNCPMGPNARKVGGRGTIDSPLVMILEAPGSEELKYGAPVCGPSGDLLDKSVPDDFDYDQAFVINAMQCRPPKTNDPHKDKDFKSRACSACRQRVLSQIFRYPRKVVLAMGAWSNSALLADYNFRITMRRGEVYAINNPDTGDEIVVVPAVHPAFLLRGAGNPKTFRDDVALAHSLAFASETVDLPVRRMDWHDPSHWVLHTLEEFAEYVKYLGRKAAEDPSGKLVIASDIETTGFDPWIEIIRSIGFYIDDSSDCASIIPKEALLDPAYCYYIRLFLKDERFAFVWQNGKFDQMFLVIEELLHIRQQIVHEDTLLLSYSLSEATKDHDLDEQAKNALGVPDHKHIIKQWGGADKFYRNAPDVVLFDYQAKDLKKTYFLYQHNRPVVEKDVNLDKLYTQTLIPSSHMLLRVEHHGICTDPDFVKVNRFGSTHEQMLEMGLPLLYDEKKDKRREHPLEELGLENEMVIVEKELEAIVGYKVNPSSPGEVSDLLYKRYGLKIKNKKPTDTRKETLDKLPPHPAVKLIRKYRKLRKMLGTYVAAIEKHAVSNIIHTTYKIHGTTTGRLSSSDPNVQNVPREARYRRMYRSRPGYVLLESDYNSAELRLLAALSGDPTLTAIFLDDKRNLHDEVSVQMYGEDFTDDQRIRAKAINFGIPYGRDAFSIAEEFDISVREAQRLIDAWFGQFPEAEKFLSNSARAASSGRTLITMFGRKRRPGVVSQERVDGLQNEFKNFHMQSPISDFTLHSSLQMQDPLEEFDSHVVNLIHDALLIEVPNDPEAIIAVHKLVSDIMVNVPREWITTPIEFKTEFKLGTWWGLCPKYEKWLDQYEENRPKIHALGGLQ